jgi:alcohol dehydrogenase (NADP+)
MGAEVYALSHSDRKLADAEKLGCKKENFIIAKDKEATKAKWSRTFDVRCSATHSRSGSRWRTMS